VRQLVIKVLNIIDARCNHEVKLGLLCVADHTALSNKQQGISCYSW